MEQDKVQKLVAQIAALLQEDEKKPDDYAALLANFEKISERLTNIEKKLETSSVYPSSLTLHPSQSHPSQEKFQNLEELADKIMNSFQNEKACPYEPTGKPCDHCAMCNSRVFVLILEIFVK
jgi:hypothetical protein